LYLPQNLYPLKTKKTKLDIVRFAPKKGVSGFHDALRLNIDQYFETTGLSPNRNRLMVWKTVAMLSIYFVPFIAILAGAYSVHPFLFYMCWFVMGIGVVGIGTSVMHDGNHGAYTGNKGRDKFIGLVIHLVGGNDISWKIQHNILHHTYTNIDGLDDDIDAGTLLRFTPHSRKVPMHRYQHLYAWFVYSLMTLYWCTAKDFLAVINYNRLGLLKKERISLGTALLEVTLSKILYFSIFLVLPLLLSGAPWTSVLLGFILMHFVAGLSLACIFQLAHVMEESDFAKPSDDRKMGRSPIAKHGQFCPYKQAAVLVYRWAELPDRASLVPAYLPCALPETVADCSSDRCRIRIAVSGASYLPECTKGPCADAQEAG
jgi:linoleoyl-CoA desaturase